MTFVLVGSGLTGTAVKLVYTANTNASGTATGGTLKLEDAQGNVIGSAVTLTAAQVTQGGSVNLGTGTQTLKLTFNTESNLFRAATRTVKQIQLHVLVLLPTAMRTVLLDKVRRQTVVPDRIMP